MARPNLRSAAAGFPIVSDDDTKSKRSSTNWKARPRFLPYWKAVSTSGASAPDIVAACGRNIRGKLNKNHEMFEVFKNENMLRVFFKPQCCFQKFTES